jgi:hypothetical protein
MNEVCVNITVQPGSHAQQRSWAKLWQILLAPEARKTHTQREVGSKDASGPGAAIEGTSNVITPNALE